MHKIVATGTPEDIVKVKPGYTAQSLAPVLGRAVQKRNKRTEAAE